MITNTRKNKKKLNTRLFSILTMISIIGFVFLYLYSYHLSVNYASIISKNEDRISNLKSEISEIEFQIVESKRKINKELAFEKGFVELQEVVFVKRTPKTALNAISN